ncbi:hypothetical protein [Tersicoccus sp. Bi-70]|uniref:hypothetical protein n=1 Tax=Tersicoccus sp. Bi-70 TaxID=1897634 RepID=UPI0009776A74|nr:hypothetical protein [Tersicoccus sp. Bi-70]OMH32306.1 hypothetical protein BGP79_07605 [Tersicoccus sp. Bi-70]
MESGLMEPQHEELGDLLVLPTAAAESSVPSHCGRPMRQRRLEFGAMHDRANHVIAQAALEGRRVLACECGFLHEQPVSGEAVLVPDDVDPRLFVGFFGRRVLAAAGHAESLEWSLDQSRDGGASGQGPVDDALVAEFDDATRALEAELLLALGNRVPGADLARDAGIEESEIADLLHRHGVTGIAAAESASVSTAVPLTVAVNSCEHAERPVSA